MAFWVETYVDVVAAMKGDDSLDFAIVRASEFAEGHPAFAAQIIRAVGAAVRVRRREVGDLASLTYVAACTYDRPWPAL